MKEDVAAAPDASAVGRRSLPVRRKLLFAACVVVVAICVSIVIAEFVCRALIPIPDHYELTDDPILYYRLAPNVDCVEQNVRYTHSSRRTRGPHDYPDDVSPGVHRVAWVGDSACFGCGVGDKDTAPYLFSAGAGDAGAVFESVNFAVPGYNVRQVREVVAQRCAELRGVRTIVYYHHLNDIINAPWAQLAPFVPADLYWKYERPGNPIVRLLKRSALVRRVGHTNLAASVLRRPSKSPQPAATADTFSVQCASLYDEGASHGAQFRDDLHAMAAEAKRQGADFVMVYFPVRNLLGRRQSDRVARALVRWCGQRGIKFLDVSEQFATAKGPGLYADSIHPGKVGQRIVADAVRELLTK